MDYKKDKYIINQLDSIEEILSDLFPNKIIKDFIQKIQDIEFDSKGENLEIVYENLVKRFLKNRDILESKNLDFKEILALDKEIQKLEKMITTLKNKRNKEKQFNKKAELNKEMKQLTNQLTNLKG